MKRLVPIVLASAVNLQLGCSSTPENLDIVITPENSTTADMLVRKTEEGVRPARVIEWQHFFKTHPTSTEVLQLKQQIKNLNKKETMTFDQILTLARAERAVGELEKSEVTYRTLIRKNSDNFDANIELAQVFLEKNQVSLAFDYLTASNKILKSQETPAKTDLYRYKYTLAIGMQATNRIDEARRMLSDLISNQRDFILAYQALAHSYLNESKYDLAEFIANRGIERTESHAPLLNVLGIVREKRGELARATEYYNKALKQNPNLVAALVNRANLSIRKSEYDAAESDLKNAITNGPYFANAYISMGVLYQRTGRFTSAKSFFEKALSIRPENAYARYNLASLYDKEFENPNKALRLYYEVVQSSDKTDEIKELALIQIQGLRDSRISLNK
ncbi:MAG: tetratricopeptide repeat protein [Pseudobacteriovorax sp.]|nr:tetratricopeptide repeat protein [Pseudobacteriovorax sp.]